MCLGMCQHLIFETYIACSTALVKFVQAFELEFERCRGQNFLAHDTKLTSRLKKNKVFIRCKVIKMRL